MKRQLPSYVLNTYAGGPGHLEAESVQLKFSKRTAVVGEDSVDYVAHIYMNAAANLYWLPRFLTYLQTGAPRDSFHYEVMLTRLAEDRFTQPIRELANDDEVSAVRAYLSWLKLQPHQIELDVDRDQYAAALKLWC
jgi:hypothetical protein